MKLKSLKIHQMPGFERKGLTYEEEFSPGITLIIGPNGSGKTATCRAIRGLLWPRFLSKVKPLFVESTWIIEDKKEEILLEGKERSFFPLKEPKWLKNLPPYHLSGCFTLSIDELFDGEDTSFAEAIIREGSGGYDLAKALAAFNTPKFHGRRQEKLWQEATSSLRKKQQEQSRLEKKGVELTKLDEQITLASEARTKLSSLEKALSFKEKEEEKKKIDLFIERFPKGIELLQGDEKTRLSLLEKEEETRETKEKKLLSDLHKIKEKIESLPKIESSEKLIIYREKKNALLAIEGEKKEIERKLSRLQSRIDEEITFLSIREEDLNKLTSSDLAELREKKKEIENKKRGIEEIQSRKESFVHCHEDLSSLEKGIALLKKLQKKRSFRKERFFWILFSGALFTLPFLRHPLFWLFPLCFGCGVAIFLLFQKKRERGVLFAYNNYVKELSLPSLAKNSLGETLSYLETQREHILKKQGDGQIRSALEEREKELEKELDQLKKNWKEGETLPIEKIEEVRQLLIEKGELEKEKEGALEEYALLIQEIGDFFAKHLGERPLLAKEGEALWEALLEKKREKESLEQLLAQKEELLSHVQKEKAGKREEKQALLHIIGERGSLEERLAALPSYKKSALKQKELEVECAFLASEISEELFHLDKEKLLLEEIKYRSQADQYESLLKEKIEGEKELEIAQKGYCLEEKEREWREATKNIKSAYREGALLSIVRFLLTRAKGAYQMEKQPKVWKKADELFIESTRGAYRLHFPNEGEKGAHFLAWDIAKGKTRGIEELSRATRIQLLFSIRLAFALLSEKERVTLPIICDETFAHADPDRFSFMVEILSTLAKKGRQIFYFSSSPSDLSLWRKQGEVQVIYLDRKKQRAQSNEIPLNLFITTKEERELLKEEKIYTSLALLQMDPSSLSPQIALRVEIATFFLSLSQKGVEKTFSQDSFEKVGISSRYMAPLHALARECSYNPKLFLEKITSIKGFRVKSVEKLKNHFIDKKYLTKETPLSLQEIEEALLEKSHGEEKEFIQKLTQFHRDQRAGSRKSI